MSDPGTLRLSFNESVIADMPTPKHGTVWFMIWADWPSAQNIAVCLDGYRPVWRVSAGPYLARDHTPGLA